MDCKQTDRIDNKQLIYLDFDGAETVYANRDLDIALNVTVNDSGFSLAEQQYIVSTLSEKYQDQNIVFTTGKPLDGGLYSTVYIGKTSDFDQYGSFAGLAETIDRDNQIKNDNAFVMLDSDDGSDLVISIIDHELGHIVEGKKHFTVDGDLDDYAASYLLTTQWHQNDPYNSYCPFDPYTNKRSVTGCVATASAQIVYYWVAQRGLDLQLTVNNSTIDSKLANFKLGNTDSIAALCYAAGLLAGMIYSPEGSSASSENSRYVFSGTGLKSTYTQFETLTNTHWNLLISDLKNSRPVLLSINDSNGYAAGGGGHAIVADGYDSSNGKIHLNFGWGGSYDGWYSFTQLKNEFKVCNLVTGICPGDDWGPTVPKNVTASVIGKDSVQIKWDAAYDLFGVTKYEIKYQSSYGAAEKIYTTTSTSYILKNLTSSNYHHVYIRAIDNSGNASDWSESATFKTSKLDITLGNSGGLSDKIVISSASGTNTDDVITVNDYVYIDFSVFNNSAEDIDYHGNSYYDIFLDGKKVRSSYFYGLTLSAGMHKNIEDIVIGKNLSPGEHEIKVVIDSNNAITEADEDNNTYAKTFIVIDSAASSCDLYVSAISTSANTVSTSQGVTLSFTVGNKGADSAVSTYAYIYDGNTKLGQVTVGAVAAGGYTTASYTIVAGTLAAGSHSLRVELDATDLVNESNEDNNSGTTALTVKTPTPTPPPSSSHDLRPYHAAGWSAPVVISSVTGTNTDTALTINDNVYLDFAVEDYLSNDITSPFYVEFYLDDSYITRWQRNSLAGDRYMSEADYNLGKLSAGLHTVEIRIDSSNNISETNEGNNTFSKTFTVTAPVASTRDLYVSAISTSANTVSTSQGVTLSFTVGNKGTGSAVSTYAYIYDGNTKLGQVTVGAVAAGGYTTASYTIVAGTLSAGYHSLRVELDATDRVTESNEYNNNSASIALTVTAPVASTRDLYVSAISTSAHTVSTSQGVTLSFTVSNYGTGSAVSTYAYIYDGNTKLGQVTVGAVAAGGYTTASYTIAAGTLAAGSHSLWVELDATDRVTESNEYNNSGTTALTVTAPVASTRDLYVSAISTSANTVSTSQGVTLSFTVSNYGTGSAVSTYAYIYDGNTKLGQVVVDAVAAGGYTTASYTIVAGTLAAGSHSLRVELDATDRVTESNEYNNSASTALTVTAPAAPDLTVASVHTGYGSVSAGQAATLYFTVYNLGNSYASASRAYIYDGNTKLGEVVVGAMAVNGYYHGSFNIAGSKLGAGTHNLRVVADATDLINESNEDNNTANYVLNVAEPLGADLQLVNVQTNAVTVSNQQAVTVKFTVKNNGNYWSNAVYTTIYDGDKGLGDVVVGMLAPGGSYEASYTIAAGTLTVGTHNLRIVADSTNLTAELNENNNSAIKAITVVAPDLLVAAVAAASASVTTAQAAQLNFTVKNNGTAAAVSSYAYIYDGNTKLGQVVIGSIAAGGSYQGVFNIAAGTLAAGSHNLRVVLDATNRVSEANESNNTAATALTVTKIADLSAGSIKANAASVPNTQAVALSFTVKNNGTAAAVSSYAYIYDGNTKLGQVIIGSVAAGGSYSGAFNIAAGTLAVGSHNLRVVLDATNRVSESNEGNNTAAVAVNITENRRPDLNLSNVTLSAGSINTVQAVRLNFTVKNSGTAGALSSYAYIYDGNTKLGQVIIGSVAAGGSYSGAFNIAAGTLAVGSHNLRVVLDATNRVSESNEGNNTTTATLTVNAAKQADLSIGGLSLNAITVSTAQAVRLNFTVKNTGTAGALSSYAYIYDGNTKLGQVIIGSVAAGGSYSGAFNIAAGTLAAGKHNLRVVLDATNRVSESNEGNNTTTAALTVNSARQADLSMGGLSLSASTVSTAKAVKLNFTVKNTGTAGALSSYAYIYDGNTKLGQVIIGSVAAGGSYSGAFNIAAGTLAAGKHTLRVVLDATNRVSEFNEADNTIDVAVNVVRAEAAAPVVWENLGQGDFDDDGLMESLLLDELSGTVVIQTAEHVVTLGSIEASEYELTAIADFNQDGCDDVLWSCQNENTLWQIKNNAVAGVMPLEVLA